MQPTDLVESSLVPLEHPHEIYTLADIRNRLIGLWLHEQDAHPDYFRALQRVALSFGMEFKVTEQDPLPWKVQEHRAIVIKR